MRDIVFLVAPVAGVVLPAAAVLVLRSVVRRRSALAARSRPAPRSVVHVLTDEGELRAAVERASRFERAVAEALESRAARYESMLAGEGVPELRAVPEPDTDSDRQPRPA